MEESMDVFGQAVYDYYKKGKFDLVFVNKGEGNVPDLSRYFRNYDELTKLEKELINLAKDNILDVGCATGHYIPFLMKKGKVFGIDVSKNLIKITKEKYKLSNCKVADIFSFNSKNKFDSITLLENNMGMGGNVKMTKKLLKKLKSLLNNKGKILAILRNIKVIDYYEADIIPIYNGKRAKKFNWIHLNKKFLAKLCSEINLKLRLIDKDKKNILIEIKNSL